MGQYFKAVNVTKKEVVCPWCLGGVAKLIEWALNPWGAVFTLLLRKSDKSGGGDYYGYRTMSLPVEETTPKDFAHALSKIAMMEGRPVTTPDNSIVGRWAGDKVYLVGDYDNSKLFRKSESFRNISAELVDAWNRFVDVDEMKLKYNPNCSCNGTEKEAAKK